MNNLVSFTPLMRQTIGFDRFNDLFETMLSDKEERFESYPPYNIEKLDESNYRIVMAVAGFGEKDLNITAQDDRLSVSGKIVESEEEDKKSYLHRGIAGRSFERTFRLADHIKVKEADLKDGLLMIDLERIVPEEKKPRMIPIKTATSGFLSGKKK
jgi:molecular chaperone IbpA